MSSRWRAPVLGVLGALLATPIACDRGRPDLEEWTPRDHRHTGSPGPGQVRAGADGGVNQAAPSRAVSEIEEVTWIAWRRRCTPCHGTLGRGDGPEGPLVKATDLGDAGWQRSVDDARIAESIRVGKGAMPSFKLPERTVDNLVKLIRLLDRSRRRPRVADASTEAPTDSAAPAASATTE